MAANNKAGVKWIDGREYLLCGRYFTKAEAETSAAELRREWTDVRVRYGHYLWSIWVHGAK